MPANRFDLIAGRYRLEKIVGSGSSAEVWSAEDRVLSRPVAIKLLGSRTSDEKARIWREARLAALLGDTVAVPIYDFGYDGTHVFLVMELVTTPSLRSFLRQHPVWESTGILSFAALLLEALVRTRKLSIVHRDLKPENIFVEGSPQGFKRVRLVDFGLAFVNDKVRGSLGRLTDDDVLSGTPEYLSPEQAQGIEIGNASDIYSAGCVLHEICAGVPPFQGGLGELLSKHIYVPAIPLRERELDLPDTLMDLVDSMLVKAVKDRPTASEALARLHKISDTPIEGRSAGHGRGSQLTREERMVEESHGLSGASQAEPLRAAFERPCPTWLEGKLKAANVLLVADPKDADVYLMTPAQGQGLRPVIDLPRVVWLESVEEMPLAKLIASGASLAVVAETDALDLRRHLQRITKIHRRTA